MLHAARAGNTAAWNRQSLAAALGYGLDYLFLDAVQELRPQACRATFRVPHAAPWLDAHFRGLPIMPGALIAEGFGQAAALLFRCARGLGSDQVVLVARIREASFVALVRPGELLVYSATLARANARAALVQGDVATAAGPVARIAATLLAADRETLAGCWSAASDRVASHDVPQRH
ncbi:MAG: 3-hydroxyacyl-ACP dehydratase FabZ family protein [Burkholderiales bacterium]